MASSLYQHLQESGTGENHMPLDAHADVDIGGREIAGAARSTPPKKIDVFIIIMHITYYM